MTKTNVNELIKREKELMAKYLDQISILLPNEGETYGRSFTNNNQQYFDTVVVVKVNEGSMRVKAIDPSGTVEHREVVMKRKPTTKNRLFPLTQGFSEQDVKELDQVTRAIHEWASGKLNEYWSERIEKADAEHKAQGVYKESEVFVIDGSGLRKSHDSFGVSV